MNKMRIDKFVASQLNISRKDAKQLLHGGNVSINGIVEKKAERSIDADSDTVFVKGKQIVYKKHIYIMQHKPEGVVSSTDSPGDITVIDILPEELKRSSLFPAGRLDKYTTGFVLVTDDGDFAHNILSPSHHVKKYYEADISAPLADDDISRFLEGMTIGREEFKPAEIKLLRYDDSTSLYKYLVVISEGRYHQIRRMFDSTGKPVVKLHRTGIGGLMLDPALKPGESREISTNELEILLGKSL